jgi:outer membrane receptor protein involved in Fe transport
MITPVDIQIMSLKLDYEQSFLGGKLGVGFKSSLVDTDNTFEFYDVIDNDNILNDTRSNNFRYKENVNAAYFNFNKKWKKMNVQFGLRAEHTNSDGKLNSLQQNENERVKRNYLNLFPSGGLTYTLNPQNSLALTYSKRIERPNYRSLNPFEVQIDELSFSRGNPFLQPQYTDNIKISHTFKYVLNTSLSYSKISNFTAQVTDAEGENRSVIQAQNIANQEVINLGISCPFDATKWWSVFLSLNASRSSFEAKDERYVAITQNNLSFYGQNNFTLPKGFQFEISGWYSSPSVWGGTYQTKSLGSLDIALQKKFLEDKLSIRLAVSDILFTSPWRGETRFANVYIRGNGGWESRQFRVNLSYLFGNNKMKSARNRNTGIEDENKRTE